MRKRSGMILIVFLLLAIGALQAYREYYRTNTDLFNVQPDYRVQDSSLVHAFVIDETAACKKYLGKVVAVEGVIKAVNKDDRGCLTVTLGRASAASAVRCSIDSTHSGEIHRPATGGSITLKGVLIGFDRDETGLLGSDVQLTRCVPAH